MKHRFGLRGNTVLHISELTIEERGKACNCICPYCKDQLVAKMGEQNVHHFAHAIAECNPHKAFESAIHLLAKDILVEKKCIKVPTLYLLYLMAERINEIEDGIFDLESETTEECIIELESIGEQEADEMTQKVIDEQIIFFEEIATEVRVNNFIPDVLIKTNRGIPLAIEIAVTHFVDAPKKKKIEGVRLATIEIDLSHWLKKDTGSFNRKDLEEDIVQSTHNKRWIYSPKIKRMKDKFHEEIYEILQAAENDERRIKEEERHRENRISQIIEQRKILTQAQHKEILIQHKEALKRDIRIRILLEKLGVRNKVAKKISCCNVYIPGEEVLDCDRRLWQTYLVHHILKEAKQFNVDQLTECLRKEFDSCIEPSLSVQFQRNDIRTLADVVRVYMFHLYKFGVITPYVYSRKYRGKIQIHTPISDPMRGRFKSLYHNITAIPFKDEYACINCGELTVKWECMMSYRSCLCENCFDEFGISN